MRYRPVPSPWPGNVRHLVIGARTAQGFAPCAYVDLPAELPRFSVAIALWGLRRTLRHMTTEAH